MAAEIDEGDVRQAHEGIDGECYQGGGGHHADGHHIGEEIERLAARARLHGLRRDRLPLARHHLHADVVGLADQIVDDGAAQQLLPARALGFAHEDARDIVRARIGKHVVGDAAAWNGDGLAPQALGQAKGVGDAVALDLREPVVARGLDVDDAPFRLQLVGDAPRLPHHLRRARALRSRRPARAPPPPTGR